MHAGCNTNSDTDSYPYSINIAVSDINAHNDAASDAHTGSNTSVLLCARNVHRRWGYTVKWHDGNGNCGPDPIPK